MRCCGLSTTASNEEQLALHAMSEVASRQARAALTSPPRPVPAPLPSSSSWSEQTQSLRLIGLPQPPKLDRQGLLGRSSSEVLRSRRAELSNPKLRFGMVRTQVMRVSPMPKFVYSNGEAFDPPDDVKTRSAERCKPSAMSRGGTRSPRPIAIFRLRCLRTARTRLDRLRVERGKAAQLYAAPTPAKVRESAFRVPARSYIRAGRVQERGKEELLTPGQAHELALKGGRDRRHQASACHLWQLLRACPV